MSTTEPAIVSESLIAEALDNAGLDEESLRRDYSGRAMYGAVCFGIVGTPVEFFAFGVEIGQLIGKLDVEDNGSAENDEARGKFDDQNELIRELIQRARIDSMGRQEIMYFPGHVLGDEQE